MTEATLQEIRQWLFVCHINNEQNGWIGGSPERYVGLLLAEVDRLTALADALDVRVQRQAAIIARLAERYPDAVNDVIGAGRELS